MQAHILIELKVTHFWPSSLSLTVNLEAPHKKRKKEIGLYIINQEKFPRWRVYFELVI